MKTFLKKNRGLSGQSLVEVLVSIGIAAILIGGAAAAISLALRQDLETRVNQTADTLMNGLLSSARETANSDWHKIYDIDKGSSNKYFVVSASGLPLAIKGEESVVEAAPTNGLIGHWKLDEATGTVIYDSSATANNGAFNGTPTRQAGTNCALSGCLGFTGDNNFANIPYNGALNLTTNVTYAHWVKILNNIPASKWPVSMGSQNSHIYYAFRSRSNGTGWMFEYGNDNPTCDPSTGYTNTGVLNVGLNDWHHLAMTYDGSYIKTYFDGALLYNTNFTAGFCNNPSVNYRIGDASASTGNFLVDDVRIYNRVLTPDEIKSIYSSRIFTRSFYVENVNRDISGNIADVGTDDPSTQLITATVSWLNRNITKQEYITRSRNKVFNQSSWLGGGGQSGVIIEPNDRYDTSENVIISNNGTITIDLSP